jgi:hypothetical protein
MIAKCCRLPWRVSVDVRSSHKKSRRVPYAERTATTFAPSEASPSRQGTTSPPPVNWFSRAFLHRRSSLTSGFANRPPRNPHVYRWNNSVGAQTCPMQPYAETRAATPQHAGLLRRGY